MAGRGRGFLRNLAGPTALRRPGQVVLDAKPRCPSPELDSMVRIQRQIRSLHVGESADEMAKLVAAIKLAVQTEEQMQTIVNMISAEALGSRENAVFFGVLFGHLSLVDINGINTRSYILNALQKGFESRLELREMSVASFRNSVVHTCEVFEHVRLKDKSPIGKLGEAVIMYLEMLLDPTTEESTKIICKQLQTKGADLEKCAPRLMKQFLTKIRKTLIDNRNNATVRRTLLYVLELALGSWEPLSSDVEAFYASMIKAGSQE